MGRARGAAHSIAVDGFAAVTAGRRDNRPSLAQERAAARAAHGQAWERLAAGDADAYEQACADYPHQLREYLDSGEKAGELIHELVAVETALGAAAADRTAAAAAGWRARAALVLQADLPEPEDISAAVAGRLRTAMIGVVRHAPGPVGESDVNGCAQVAWAGRLAAEIAAVAKKNSFVRLRAGRATPLSSAFSEDDHVVEEAARAWVARTVFNQDSLDGEPGRPHPAPPFDAAGFAQAMDEACERASELLNASVQDAYEHAFGREDDF